MHVLEKKGIIIFNLSFTILFVVYYFCDSIIYTYNI